MWIFGVQAKASLQRAPKGFDTLEVDQVSTPLTVKDRMLWTVFLLGLWLLDSVRGGLRLSAVFEGMRVVVVGGWRRVSLKSGAGFSKATDFSSKGPET